MSNGFDETDSAVFPLATVFTGCSTVSVSEKAPSAVERNTGEAKQEPTRENSFDKPKDHLPIQVREALLNSKEIEILVLDESNNQKSVEKFKVQGFPVWANRITKLKDSATSKLLTESLFRDLGPTHLKVQAACFIPRHTIKAKYKDTYIVIAVCYQCRNFKGMISKKKFGDAIPFKQLEGEVHFSGSVVDLTQSSALPIFESIFPLAQ